MSNKISERVELYENQAVRAAWVEAEEEWYFSIKDGKKRATDVANTEQLLRLIQSIPSKKAEPYKNLKGLKKENLRDNMTDLELVLTMLSEATTKEISEVRKPASFDENVEVARAGGSVAGNARKEIEEKTGRPVISSKNAAELNQLVVDMIEVAPHIEEEEL